MYMKQNKLFIGLATIAAVLTFASCSSDEQELMSHPSKARTITFTTSLSTTRATNDPQAGTSLSTGSALAIWAINNSSSEVLNNGDNEQYSVNGSGTLTPKTAANTMTWPDGATLDFYAYAPYNNGYSYNAANTFAVQADQTSDGYLTSDLVLAQATNKTYNAETPVALSFKHLMSKINITIQKATGAEVDLSKAKVTITNTKLKATFKPSATNEESDKILGDVDSDNDPTDILAVSALGAATTACAIIVPQTLASGTALVKIETTSEATSGANRTLIAKLSGETTFASGQSYNFTVTVNDLATPSSDPEEVELELGSASLVQWGSNDLGAATGDAYYVGDYILRDGTLVHKADLTNDQKSQVAAIIFDPTSHDNGWDGYAMSVVRSGNRKWPTAPETITEGPSTLSAALNAYNGMTLTNAIVAKIKGESESVDWTTDANKDYFVNFTGSGGNGFSNALTGENLSGWFAPSFGQMIQILNVLGDANFKESDVTELKNNNPFFTGSTSNVYTTINNLVKNDLGLSNDVIPTNTIFTTATENETNFWYVKFTETNNYLELGRSAGKGTGGRSVLPIVAYKLPTE